MCIRDSTLTYTKNGDYLIPDLKLSEQQSKPLGKYGRMRKSSLTEHRPILYHQLLMSEKLYPHLIEIDETAPVSYTHLDVYTRQHYETPGLSR